MSNKSFFQAFKDRYLDTGDLDLEELTIKSKQKFTKDLVVVEIVGRDRAIDTFKNLKNLEQIVLNNCSIQHSYSDDELMTNEQIKSNLKSNQSIKSLDLSCNEIDKWIDIVKIVELFPNLKELIISGNRFCSIDLTNLDWQIKVLNRIENLVAGKLSIDWYSIEQFDKLFINLKNLNLFHNNLINVQLTNCSSFLNIQYLSLSENQINWFDVLNLRQFHNLKHLQLDNCKIDEIIINESNLFANLTQLNLNNNQLFKWCNISELAKFVHLTDLSIRDNPLFKDQDYDVIFNFIVGILKSLKVLNRQIITNDKRKEAEIYFLRTNFRSWTTGQLESWNINRRFEELIEIYGKPVDLLKDVQVNKFLNVNLIDGEKSFKKKLLKTMDICTLRLLVQRLFNLDDQTNFDLWYLNDDKDLEFKLDQPNKNLEFYPINDNCTIKLIQN